MSGKKSISIVMPVFNEEGVLRILYERLVEIVNPLPYSIQFLFVDDGSIDESLQILHELQNTDNRVQVLELARNFGHQNALSAGIDCAEGDAIILMDVDLEDNPVFIKDFIKKWEEGYNVVYARRGKREVGFLKRSMYAMFHKINYRITDINLEPAGIFCLMDREAVDLIKNLPERNRYIPGLRTWIGLSQIGILVDRDKRYDSTSRVRTRALFNLAFDSFVSFSTVPLQVAMLLGLLFSCLSFLGIITIVALKLTWDLPVQGWASTICVILLIGGIQLICIWLQGEYISRIFHEVKNRPNYIIQNKTGFKTNGR